MHHPPDSPEPSGPPDHPGGPPCAAPPGQAVGRIRRLVARPNRGLSSASDRVSSASAGRRGRIAVAVMVAVLVHAAGAVAVRHLARTQPPRAPATQAISQAAAQRAVLAARKRQSKRTAPAQPPKKEVEPTPAVVALPPPSAHEVPLDAKYAAEHDHRAEQEQRSRDAQLRPNALAPKREVGERVPPPAPTPAPTGSPEPASPSPSPQAPSRASPPGRKAGLALKTTPRGERSAARAQPKDRGQDELKLNRPLPAGGGGPRRPLTMAELLPSAQQLARIDAAPMADVTDPSIPEGDETALNASAYRYASFYNRLKQGVASHWNIQEALRLRDATGSALGSGEHTTVVAVTLRADGTLKAVTVERGCGVRQLDQAATTAFERAQPFLGVPAGLLNARAEVDFLFEFRLSPAGGGIWGSASP